MTKDWHVGELCWGFMAEWVLLHKCLMNALIRHAYGVPPSPEIGGRHLADGILNHDIKLGVQVIWHIAKREPSPDPGGRCHAEGVTDEGVHALMQQPL